MQPGKPEVVTDLQDAAQILAHIGEQFMADAKQLKKLGVKWLARYFKKWAREAQGHLGKVVSQILAYGEDPDYECGKVEGADEVDDVLTRAETLLAGGHDTFCDFRKASWDAKADYTPDIYEHAIGDFQDALVQVETEIHLVGSLGVPGYIGARLEDD